MYLPLNNELVGRINQSEIDVLNSRLKRMEEQIGNPMDVEMRRFGHAVAFSAKNIPGPAFNVVKGLQHGDEKYISDIIAFYRQRNIDVTFEVIPSLTSPQIMEVLSNEGYYQCDFHTTLFHSILEKIEYFDSNITIRRLDRNEFNIFLKYIQKDLCLLLSKMG